MKGDHGFVLVNALILVAALASVAAFLLARSEAGQARLQSGLGTDQLTLNLDAFDALAMTMLTQDTGAIDHTGEAWAKPLPPVDLARGKVTGKLQDLQGRFNLNWLAIPGNTLADEAFDILLARLGIAPETGTAMRLFLRPGGPSDRSRWLQLDPPLAPAGGAILDVSQLAQIPGISERNLERLAPYITALTGMTQLNVNTADAEILAAFFPDVPPAELARLIGQRQQEPFPSSKAFLIAVGLAEAEQAQRQPTEEVDEDGEPQTEAADEAAIRRTEALEAMISVGSEWFEVQSSAEYEGVTARRRTILQRKGVPAVIELKWRLSFRS
ncbi:type II secretion system minor pseudopilin GspK [Primorskyibacter sp. 2E233]|uniref:type II secretion system minor pseudopilin GspK n=1 Tax=Primorskyibacter sp. 2E233 TaxID=3413431 RepID=UPI003BF2C4C7